jgi:hypothetical protein
MEVTKDGARRFRVERDKGAGRVGEGSAKATGCLRMSGSFEQLAFDGELQDAMVYIARHITILVGILPFCH